jgi:hypothetical protein
MKQTFTATIFVLGLIILFAGGAFAQKGSVTGEWDGSFNTPGGPRPMKLIFKADGEKLTGTVKRSSGDLPLTGTIKGSDINFSYTVSYNGNDLTLSFTGKVTGDNMSGSVSFAGQAEETWSAKRAAGEKPKTE